MYIGDEPVGGTDNSRIARSKMYDKCYKVERLGSGPNMTYFITWRDGKKAGTQFLINRRSAAKKMLSLMRDGFSRIF